MGLEFKSNGAVQIEAPLEITPDIAACIAAVPCIVLDDLDDLFQLVDLDTNVVTIARDRFRTLLIELRDHRARASQRCRADEQCDHRVDGDDGYCAAHRKFYERRLATMRTVLTQARFGARYKPMCSQHRDHKAVAIIVDGHGLHQYACEECRQVGTVVHETS